MKFNKSKKEKYYDKETVAYSFSPPCNIPKAFITEVFQSCVSPKDRWVETERGNGKIPEWMWEMLTTDNENSKQSTEDSGQSPAQMYQNQSPNMRATAQTLPIQITPNQRTQLSPFRMQQQTKIWSKRAHHLQMEKKTQIGT